MPSIIALEGEEPPLPDRGSVGRGVGIAGAVNIGALLVGIISIGVGIGILIVGGFGLVQFFWIVPVYSRFDSRGETETAKGILIAAGITFLLSAACWGSVLAVGIKVK